MRRSILVVLMVVMVATPCIAQDVQPEGIFSIRGTLWNGYLMPFAETYLIGFYQGHVYNGTSGFRFPFSFYLDVLLFSGFYMSDWDNDSFMSQTGVLFPLLKFGFAIGLLFDTQGRMWGFPVLLLSVFTYENDNWIPPGVD